MIINGVKDYNREGQEQKTVLFAGRATKDGELCSTASGKNYGVISARAYNRKDGTSAFLTIKCWDENGAPKIADLKKGDSFLAAGRLDAREYQGKTYTDLVAEFVLSGGASAPQMSFHANAPVSVKADDFEELMEDDGELPF